MGKRITEVRRLVGKRVLAGLLSSAGLVPASLATSIGTEEGGDCLLRMTWTRYEESVIGLRLNRWLNKQPAEITCEKKLSTSERCLR